MTQVKIPAKMTAHVTNTSEELVNKVRAGKRITGPKAKKVLKADELLLTGTNKLLEEVSRVVNI